jgi:hypothetical protein
VLVGGVPAGDVGVHVFGIGLVMCIWAARGRSTTAAGSSASSESRNPLFSAAFRVRGMRRSGPVRSGRAERQSGRAAASITTLSKLGCGRRGPLWEYASSTYIASHVPGPARRRRLRLRLRLRPPHSAWGVVAPLARPRPGPAGAHDLTTLLAGGRGDEGRQPPTPSSHASSSFASINIVLVCLMLVPSRQSTPSLSSPCILRLPLAS